MHWFAATLPGLEGLACAELGDLGLPGSPEPGGVAFRALPADLVAVAGRLRCCAHLWRRAGVGRLRTVTDAAQLVDGLPWHDVPAPVEAVRLAWSGRGAAPDRMRWMQAELLRQLGARSAVDARVGAATGARGELVVLARADGDRVELSIDAGGGLLARRGWRQEPGAAPLREDVAAALLRLVGWHGNGALWDPMTGSGTLAIEAACGAKATAQGPPVCAGDIDPDCVARAQRNAERAGVAHAIRWVTGDVAHQPIPTALPAFVVCNPPWGDRLGGVAAARRTFQRLGAVLARDCPGWRAGFALPHRSAADTLPLAEDALFVRVVAGGRPLWLVAGTVEAHRTGARRPHRRGAAAAGARDRD
ncbi:MAG: hypothetical protein EXR79_01110 [Myxococcales bacterium]|nr:hypothetical protein [Myxococcales bacterium]